MDEPTMPFYTRLTSSIKKIKSKVKPNRAALLGIVVGLGVTVGAVDVYIKNHTNYIVKIDNNVVGVVDKLEEFESVVKTIASTDGEAAAGHLSFEKTMDTVTNLITSYDVERIAREKLNLKMAAVAVSVGGEEVLKLQGHEDVNKLLEEVKKYYTDSIEGDTVSIISSSIKESIETEAILADPSEILDINGAVQKIVAGKGEQKKYKIKKGDTIWDIAQENNVDIEEIQEANPNMNLEKIQIDQEINLAVTVPYLNVEVVAEVKEKGTIPYETKTINDKTMAKGVTKVKQSGKNGQTEIEKKVTVLNGIIVKEDVLNTKVVEKAVEKVVVVGTKAPANSYSPTYIASSGSGMFSWPARGKSITSRFGRRWGRMHNGIDIDGNTGDPIAAAAAGTVKFAGYKGSFGNLVIISHGNGYETYYAHQSKIKVKAGQSVSKGEVIGYIGSTGRSTGSHLHFEVRKNGTPQNPLSFLK